METWGINTKGFRLWLSGQFYRKYGTVPGSQAIKDALNVIAGRAVHDGPQVSVETRIANTDAGIWLDLADDPWRAINVTSTGWEIVTNVPVKFRRTRGTLSLPEPVRGGNLDELREFTNLPDDDEWAVYKAFLISTLRPDGPYPILILTGEQGSAKSSASRICMSLVDPRKPVTRGLPRDPRDLMLAAANVGSWRSTTCQKLTDWLSDTLCSLSTGGGYAARELYSDGDEKIFDAKRPLILNGITDIATRPDLLDRSIILNLPPIADSDRIEEADLNRRFQEARPRILGALLDSVVMALRNRDTVKMTNKPRMADFAKWGCAAEPAHSEGPIFLKAYLKNRSSINDVAIEASLVGLPIIALRQDHFPWDGTVGELLEVLGEFVDGITLKSNAWPKSARSLSAQLKRITPNLRRQGISVIPGEKGNKGRMIRLERSTETPSRPSLSSPTNGASDLQGENGDVQNWASSRTVTIRHSVQNRSPLVSVPVTVVTIVTMNSAPVLSKSMMWRKYGRGNLAPKGP